MEKYSATFSQVFEPKKKDASFKDEVIDVFGDKEQKDIESYVNSNAEQKEQDEKLIFDALDILAGDSENQEDLQKEMVDELFEAAKKIQLASGVVTASPEDTFKDMKNILISRMHQVVKDWKYGHETKITNEEITKARVILLCAGDEQMLDRCRSCYMYKESGSIKKLKCEDIINVVGNVNEEELQMLCNHGYLEQCSKLKSYSSKDELENVHVIPEFLFKKILENSSSEAALKILKTKTPAEGYSREIFKTVAGRSIGINDIDLSKFKDVTALDLCHFFTSHAAFYPFRASEYFKFLSKSSLSANEKAQCQDYVLKHQFLTDDDMKHLPEEVVNVYRNEFDMLESISRKSYDRAYVMSENDLANAKKLIETGFMGFLHERQGYLQHFANHEYEWLISIAQKFDQLNLLCSRHLLQEKDADEYFKLLAKDKEQSLIYDAVNRGGYKLPAECFEYAGNNKHKLNSFKNLGDKEFSEILKEAWLVDGINLYHNINSFNLIAGGEYESYRQYGNLVKFVRSIAKKIPMDNLYYVFNLDYTKVVARGFETANKEAEEKMELLEAWAKNNNLTFAAAGSNTKITPDKIVDFYKFDFLSGTVADAKKRVEVSSLVPMELAVDATLYKDILDKLAGDDDKERRRSADEINTLMPSVDRESFKWIYKKLFTNINQQELSDTYASFVAGMADYSTVLKGIKDEKAKKILERSFPWSAVLPKIEATQAQSTNREHDPWRKVLIPLLQDAIDKKIISPEDKQDGILIADYIERFGMTPAKNLFRMYIEIRKTNNVEEMSVRLKTELMAIGVDAAALCAKDKSNMGLVLSKLEKISKGITNMFGEDKIEVAQMALQSEYALEIIESLKGASGFGEGGTTREALALFVDNFKASPGKFRLPEGYNEVTLSIPEIQEVENNTDQENEQKNILSNPELITAIENYSNVFTSLTDSVSSRSRAACLSALTYLTQLSQDTASSITQEESKETSNEKALIGMRQKLERITRQSRLLNEFLNEDNGVFKEPIKRSDLLEQINALVPDAWEGKRRLLMEISFADMLDKMPEAAGNMDQNAQFLDSQNKCLEYSDFLVNHVKEHYLNSKHDQVGSLESTDKNLIKALKKAWGTQEVEKNIVTVMAAKLRALARGEISEKTRSITLMPSKGILRVFTGDLGRACTSNQNCKLAKGEFENIVSYTFILDKNKANERFVGSLNVVETKTEKGERALVVRANNPQQNLFSFLDGDTLIKSVLEEMKQLAHRRGINHVLVPLDSSGQSCSNRPDVAAYYKKHYADKAKIGLENSPETNFNTYPIWNKEGKHPVVEI